MLKKQFYNFTFLLLKESRFDKLGVNFWFSVVKRGQNLFIQRIKWGPWQSFIGNIAVKLIE